MYSMTTCQYCQKAKELLSTHYNVTAVEKLVDTDRALLMEMFEKTAARSVPQIYIGDTLIGGFDALNTLHTEGKLRDLIGLT